MARAAALDAPTNTSTPATYYDKLDQLPLCFELGPDGEKDIITGFIDSLTKNYVNWFEKQIAKQALGEIAELVMGDEFFQEIVTQFLPPSLELESFDQLLEIIPTLNLVEMNKLQTGFNSIVNQYYFIDNANLLSPETNRAVNEFLGKFES